jgi:PKD repeat protein
MRAMQGRHPQVTPMDRESAVSRIFLALILAVAIIIVAVVVVFLLFPPVSGGIPSFSANAESSGSLVYLYHDGGDDLFEGTTAFLVNGRQVSRNAVTYLHGQDWPWSEGETIRLDVPAAGTPQTVEVLYVRGGEQVVVYSQQLTVGPTPSPTATRLPESVPPTPPGTPGGISVTTPATAGPTSPATEPVPPAALFTGSPREGGSPLTVQFKDLSIGEPDTWLWSFGDGKGSPERNPSHLYVEPGNFTVGLTVSNSQGSNTRIQSSYITVVGTMGQSVYLQSSTAYLLPDGSFQFRVTGPGASIKIGGTEYLFAEGDRVELFPGDVTTGTISVNQEGISEFSFSDVRMMVNGTTVREGIVSAIRVPDYDGLKSTMTIMIPSPDPAMLLFVDGRKVMPPGSGKIVLAGIGAEGSDGLFLSAKTGSLSFSGSAGISTGE